MAMTPQNPSPDKTDVLLQAVGISKTFPGVKALDDVSITVRRGGGGERKTAEFKRGEATEEMIVKAALPGGDGT